jgi:hypothetical protein
LRTDGIFTNARKAGTAAEKGPHGDKENQKGKEGKIRKDQSDMGLDFGFEPLLMPPDN